MINAIATDSKVLQILANVTHTDEVLGNLDLALFEEGLLDSLGMVEFILSLSEEFGIKISPAEINRDDWSSPRRVITYIEKRTTS